MKKQMKEELIEEYNSLIDYYNDCHNKIEILNKNTRKSKLEKMCALSLCAIIPVFIASISLFVTIPTLSINSGILYMVSITAISEFIGYIGQKVITFKSKRKMKTFTDANKNREILTELSRYELEKEKTDKRVELIDAIYSRTISRERMLNEIIREKKYTINKNVLSKEELNKNYELMLQTYSKKIKELDVMISQRYLKDKFQNYRSNTCRNSSSLTDGLMLALFISFPTCLAFFIRHMINSNVIETMYYYVKAIGNFFIPTLVVSPITIFSAVKNNNDYLYAFNELNNSLGENKLEQKPNKKVEENIEKNIEKLIDDLVELGYSIKETEHTIKEITSQKNDKEKTWDEVLIPEEEIKVYMNESPAPFNPKTIFGENETLEKKSGKKLVRRLTDNKNNN